MRKRFPGGVVGAFSARSPSATDNTQNSGVYTLDEQYNAAQAGEWQNTSGQTYQIPGSLRFNSASNPRLVRNQVSGDRKRFTISFWAKITKDTYSTFWDAGPTFGTNNHTQFYISSKTLNWYIYPGSTTGLLSSNSIFTDLTAWRHWVCVVDTPNTQASERMKVYVNGERLYSFSTQTYPAQDSYTNVGYSSAYFLIGQYIGSGWGAGTAMEGYMCEFHYIDGQTLDPSYFGYMDGNGNWQPKKYTGGYGANGHYLPMNTGPGFSTYFGNSGYIQTASSTTDFELSQSVFSIEYWENRMGADGGDTGVTFSDGTQTYASLFGYYDGTDTRLYLSSNNSSWNLVSGSSIGKSVNGQWSHILFTRDASGNVRGFRDGVLKFSTNIGTSAGITQNVNQVTIGRAQSSNYYNGFISNVRFCKGSIPTDYQTSSTTAGTVVFTPPNGTVTTTSQGATAAHVKLITCTGSDISTNLGTPGGSLTSTNVHAERNSPFYISPYQDASGNGNSFDRYNFDLEDNGSWLNSDHVTDSPTNGSPTDETGEGGVVPGNYATLDRSWYRYNTGGTYSDGNLRYTGTGADGDATYTFVRSNLPIRGNSTQKVYWETYIVSQSAAGRTSFGMVDETFTGGQYGGTTSGGLTGNMLGMGNSGLVTLNGSNVLTGQTSPAYAAGRTYNFAYDPNTGKVWMGINGTWWNSGDPAAGTGEVYQFSSELIANDWHPVAALQSTNDSATFNFGQQRWNYTAPEGFCGLFTGIYKTPVVDPSEHFEVISYVGTGNITRRIFDTLKFSPDLVWTKGRDYGGSHFIYDSVRGVNAGRLLTNGTAAETGTTNVYGNLTSFDPNGWTAGQGSSSFEELNNSGYDWINWNWRAGGKVSAENPYMRDDASFTPTHGTIKADRISANTKAGFSIVTYKANNTAGSTVAHGLGVKPAFILVKKRSASERWTVYHKMTSNAYIYLNETFAADTTNANLRFGNGSVVVQPTSSVFTIGNAQDVNGTSGSDYVAYCWAEIEGFSKFGSFRGGNADGVPFVYCGFKPRWIMIKAKDAVTNWYIWDTARIVTAGNSNPYTLRPNESSTEATIGYSYYLDIHSNGFQVRTTGTSELNATSYNYIFMAFADVPGKSARAVPA